MDGRGMLSLEMVVRDYVDRDVVMGLLGLDTEL
jgi:hypothetical protein